MTKPSLLLPESTVFPIQGLDDINSIEKRIVRFYGDQMGQGEPAEKKDHCKLTIILVVGLQYVMEIFNGETMRLLLLLLCYEVIKID